MSNIKLHPKKNLIISDQKEIPKALSAQQIMDTLVDIGKTATGIFNKNILYENNFINNAVNYTENSYNWLIHQAMNRLELPTQLVPGRYEPPFGLINKRRYSNADFSGLIHQLIMLESDTSPKDLIGLEYHIGFPWTSMEGYFHKNSIPDWLTEMGIPKPLIPLLSKAYSLQQKASGKREVQEVADNIRDICGKINPENMKVIDYADQAGDIFNYKDHIFYFRDKMKYSLLDSSHAINFPQLYWAFVLYDNTLKKPLGYTFIRANKDEPKKELIGRN